LSKKKGRLFVISAPSGAGKTTLVKKLMELRPELRFSISYTTRPRREGEVDQSDYFFVDQSVFGAMRDAGDFLEHAEVFGYHYGTSCTQVSELLDGGHDVILEIDWQGARQVRENMPGCRSIFILPPSFAELEKRLRGRGTDAEEVIKRRLGEAVDDIRHWTEFDHSVVNDDIEQSARQLLAIITGTGRPDREDSSLQARVDAILKRNQPA
jgi:guanylate kinase